jgi:hypothetical protein
MTPSVLVPALSSSCAIAFNSTPVIRNENPDRFIAGRYRWNASALAPLGRFLVSAVNGG